MWEVHWTSIVSPGTEWAESRDMVWRHWTRWGAERRYHRIIGFEILDQAHNRIWIGHEGQQVDCRPPRVLR